MKKNIVWASLRAFCLGAVIALLVAGCGPRTSQPRLRVLCGSSMAKPMQQIARAFEQTYGTEVEFDLGGSETLLPKVLVGNPGDVYVCHDPFEAKVREAGKSSAAVATGWLCPIVVTKAGGPQKIGDWSDLAAPNLRLGIGDPRYSTCGAMFVAELRRRSLEANVMRNVVVQARSHSELALAVTMGSLDAAAVWNFVGPEYQGRLEKAPLHADYPEVRVTVVGLLGSTQPALRDKFLDWCRRPESLASFADHGYRRDSATAKPSNPF